MKILIIRHAEPDYEHDSLTEKGLREAQLLADRLETAPIDHFYVSPYGRARMTAAPTLARRGVKEKILPWLREFDAPVTLKDGTRKKIPWDYLPADWTSDPGNFSLGGWLDTPVSKSGPVRDRYEEVSAGLDALLTKHGYRRDGFIYRAEAPNAETIALFCHFGLESILLSHLLNLPAVPLLHGTCALPASVTTLVTEEREQGIASFRMLCFGDTSHLSSRGEEPSFHARFCERFTNETRH